MDELITIDSEVCSGKPVIRVTRIMVKNILGMMAGGYTVGRIIAEYPELDFKQVSAALEYAANVIDEEQVLINIHQTTPACALHAGTFGESLPWIASECSIHVHAG